MARSRESITVVLEEGELVTIEPVSQLKPLPELAAAYQKGGRMPSTEEEYVLFDAGIFIGALLTGDARHQRRDRLWRQLGVGKYWHVQPQVS